MITAVLYLAAIFGVIFFVVDSILKATGWKDKDNRRAAEAFIFTSMINKK